MIIKLIIWFKNNLKWVFIIVNGVILGACILSLNTVLILRIIISFMNRSIVRSRFFMVNYFLIIAY